MNAWDGIKFNDKYDARRIIKELQDGFNRILVDYNTKIITAYNVFPGTQTQVIYL